MGRADDALTRGHAALQEESGEVATLNGECVDVLIDHFPRLNEQAKKLVELEGKRFSRIEMLRSEVATEPKAGMSFIDRSGNAHRIRSLTIVDEYLIFDCIVSPASE